MNNLEKHLHLFTRVQDGFNEPDRYTFVPVLYEFDFHGLKELEFDIAVYNRYSKVWKDSVGNEINVLYWLDLDKLTTKKEAEDSYKEGMKKGFSIHKPKQR